MRKFQLRRAHAKANSLAAKSLGKVESLAGHLGDVATGCINQARIAITIVRARGSSGIAGEPNGHILVALTIVTTRSVGRVGTIEANRLVAVTETMPNSKGTL